MLPAERLGIRSRTAELSRNYAALCEQRRRARQKQFRKQSQARVFSTDKRDRFRSIHLEMWILDQTEPGSLVLNPVDKSSPDYHRKVTPTFWCHRVARCMDESNRFTNDTPRRSGPHDRE